ncbi:hypothetical protein [Nocardia sp. A7]|uniref:hypothetical protein n=1 Tax=Nocardia sp. A7 TaxID=2789274 RepID=UPI00397B772C
MSSPQWGVPGGGENTHSWRHGEILAAFEPLEVTDAMAQAEVFERIARWWDEGLCAFQYAVRESLAQAWSSVGATAASATVDAYVAQARDLSVALATLPDVVRAAAEAIVATKNAIPPLVVEVGASTRAGGAVAAMGYGSDSAWPVSGTVQDAGSAGVAAAEEHARAEMRQRYVVPFGELVYRIPLLPMPTRRSGAVGEPGDQRLLVDGVGWLPDERRSRSAVGAGVSAEGGQNGSAAVGEVSPRARSAGDAESAGLGSDGAEDLPAGGGAFGDGPTEYDGGAPEPADGTAEYDGGATALAGDATAPDFDGGDADGAGPRGGGTAPASAEPDRVMANGVGQPGGAQTSSAPTGAVGAMAAPGGAGISGPGGGPRYQPTGQHDVQRPGVGHSVPGAAGSVISADPPAGHTASRSVDRYFHCAGAPQAAPAPAEGAAHGLPAYLITSANTAELLGKPRPAITGGVIGGDELVPADQPSSATRG